MINSPRQSRWFNDPLIRWLIGLLVILLVLTTALWLLSLPEQPVVEFTWFVPAVVAFNILSAASIAFLNFGRYQVLRQPSSFWMGIAFTSYTIFTSFYLLSFPGLAPGQRGLIAQFPNTSAWLSFVNVGLLVIILQVAVFARWPRAGAVGEKWSGWLWLAAIVIFVSIAGLSAVFEEFLPTIVVDGAFSPVFIGELYAVVLVNAAGSLLAVYRYRQSADILYGYLALTELVWAFAFLDNATGPVRYSFLWYSGVLLFPFGLAVMLFGLLSEYVGLYRREQQRTRELEALQQVTDPSLARLGLEPLLKSLLERMVVIMGANAGAILLLSPDKGDLVVMSAVGIPEAQALGCQVKVGEDFAGRVAARKKTFWVQDAQADPSIWSPYIIDNNIRGIIGVPMSIGEHVIGVVHVDFLVVRAFGRQEERLLEVAAERAALAIYQTRLLEDAQRRAAELDAIITSIADGVLTYSPTGDIVRMNPAAEKIFHYTEQERELPVAERLRVLRVENTEGKPVAMEDQPFMRALRGETVHGIELLIHRPPDRRVWLSLSTAPIRSSEGEMLGAVVTLTDISRRKQAERERERLLEKVQEERSRLQGVLDTAPVGIAFYRAPDGRPLLTNKAAEIILGRPSVPRVSIAEVATYYGIFRPSGELFSPEQLPVTRSLRGETVVEVEEIIHHPSGRKVFVQVNSAPLRDAEGQIIGAVAAFLDITRIKEQELLRDEFLSAAAHELKTPVTTIKGYAQLMRQWGPHEGRQAEAIEVINRQTDRISHRVQEMLEAVRFRKAPPEWRQESFDLRELVLEVVGRVQSSTQLHKVLLESEGPVPVVADRERIEEVVVSLLDNAIKYSPRGGDIEVRVWTDKGEALVSVGDHGVGISKDRQPHIFEPFFEPVPTGAPGYRSIVALSLYLSSLIIKGHKGRIWFESEEGKGSTFYFSLPLVKSGGNGRGA